jgi:hypothetical protein
MIKRTLLDICVRDFFYWIIVVIDVIIVIIITFKVHPSAI